MPPPQATTTTALNSFVQNAPVEPSRQKTANANLDNLFSRVADRDDYVAFEKIFKQTYRSGCSFVRRMVRSQELAEEIVDDIFCNLWKNRKKIHIQTSFKSYFLTAVRNRSLDCLRKLKKEHTSALEHANHVPSPQVSAIDTMAYHELQNKINAAVEGLPSQCRLIFRLSRDQGLTYREIAEMLSISIKTVDTQMGRALKQLRRVVKP